MIDVKDLVFEYPTQRALDHVSCTIRRGSVTALVGPNGSGKTTFIRCIAGLSTPFHGTVLFDGVDVHRDPRLAHQRMGYLSDFFGVYENLTVRQCLVFAARSYAVPRQAVEDSVRSAAERLNVASYMGKQAGTLSRGQRQRLAIAQAIIHNPAFVALDEPASGLDPEARRELAGLLTQLKDGGMTILVSSHILAELEDYCTDMLVMRDGRIVSEQSLGDAAATKGGALRLELASADDALSDRLAEIDGVANVRMNGLSASFDFAGGAAERHALLRRLIEAGVTVSGLREDRAQLQDAYFDSMRGDKEAGP